MNILKPILFSTPMVQSILSGLKNQTRREQKHEIPKYKKGDVLWVRETFFDSEKFKGAPLFINAPRYLYRADNAFIGEHNWRPSIFMPFSACRIFLQVEDVRCERLQSISQVDAINEGIEWLSSGEFKNYLKSVDVNSWSNPYHSFQSLWESTYGSENWEKNPYVWVYDFRRISHEALEFL